MSLNLRHGMCFVLLFSSLKCIKRIIEIIGTKTRSKLSFAYLAHNRYQSYQRLSWIAKWFHFCSEIRDHLSNDSNTAKLESREHGLTFSHDWHSQPTFITDPSGQHRHTGADLVSDEQTWRSQVDVGSMRHRNTYPANDRLFIQTLQTRNSSQPNVRSKWRAKLSERRMENLLHFYSVDCSPFVCLCESESLPWEPKHKC